jgi:hypothetical protein
VSFRFGLGTLRLARFLLGDAPFRSVSAWERRFGSFRLGDVRFVPFRL